MSENKTIVVNKALVEFDETINRKRGLFVAAGEPPSATEELDGSGPRHAPNKKRLLHLLHTLAYTREGRALLDEYWLDTYTPDEIRLRLGERLRREFDVDGPVLDAIIDAHLAGIEYVGATSADEAKRQSARYSAALLPILAALHDDAMGYEFSCMW